MGIGRRICSFYSLMRFYYVQLQGSIERVDAYFIPSASIRYIHFPKDFNIIEQATQRVSDACHFPS